MSQGSTVIRRENIDGEKEKEKQTEEGNSFK